MKDKGPNDLEKIIFNLQKKVFHLEEENFMLKKEIDFLREEAQAEVLRHEQKITYMTSEEYEKKKKI